MKRQRGAALMIILMIAGVVAAFFAVRALNGANTERDKVTAAALAQAKDALIGFASTYRELHADVGNNQEKPFGYLPCPDTNNDGIAEPTCGAMNVSVIGRLPWRTLGLPPLRDSAGECLWYAVSGRAKNNPSTNVAMNWDTLGQLAVTEAITNTILAAPLTNQAAWAVVFAPRAAIGGQTRGGGAGTECRGPAGVAAGAQYLDGANPFYAGVAPAAGATSTVTFSVSESVRLGTNNDQGIWITSSEIFDRVKKRNPASPNGFTSDIGSFLAGVRNELNGLLIGALPTGMATVDAGTVCPVVDNVADQRDAYLRCAWRNNLQYAAPTPATGLTVNGLPCNAVLFFAGERAPGQVRATAADFANPANYLEGGNLALFPGVGGYTGADQFNPAAPSADVVRCITGLTGTATQVSFAANLGSFVSVGAAGSVTVNAVDKTVTLADAAGAAGGCFWSPTQFPLAGRNLRAYYDYRFTVPDSFALTGLGSDRGNGFSLQMVTGSFGSAPNTCGTEVDMGVLGSADVWGHDSYIFETDVRRDGAHSDPTENHSAILLDGFLDHAPAAPSATISAACDGSATGCRHAPANRFEESPLQTHNQRIEIHTGCNAACTVCNSATHAGPTTYAQINAWIGCKDCNDILDDLLGAELIAAAANRDFSAPGSWVGTNWSVAAGVYSHVAGANVAGIPNSALTGPPVAGVSYQIAFTATTTTAGTLTVSFGGVAAPAIAVASGPSMAYSIRLTATSATALSLSPNGAWVGAIDNLSIKPVTAPNISRCVAVTPEMNTMFFGFASGFRSGASQQGVVLKNLYLRTE